MNSADNTQTPWDDSDAIAVVLFGLFIVSGGLLARLSGAPIDEPTPLRSVDVLFMLLPTAFAVALVTKRMANSRCSLRSLVGIQDAMREIIQGSVLGLLAVPLTLGLSYLTGLLITHVTGEPPSPQAVMRSLTMAETPLPVAAAVLLVSITFVPFAEEILYRGIILSVLKRHCGTVFAVIASSLFFGLLHLSPVNIPALSLLGAAFAMAYLRTRSLLTSMAMHGAFNAVNLMLLTMQG